MPSVEGAMIGKKQLMLLLIKKSNKGVMNNSDKIYLQLTKEAHDCLGKSLQKKSWFEVRHISWLEVNSLSLNMNSRLNWIKWMNKWQRS